MKKYILNLFSIFILLLVSNNSFAYKNSDLNYTEYLKCTHAEGYYPIGDFNTVSFFLSEDTIKQIENGENVTLFDGGYLESDKPAGEAFNETRYDFTTISVASADRWSVFFTTNYKKFTLYHHIFFFKRNNNEQITYHTIAEGFAFDESGVGCCASMYSRLRCEIINS